MNLLGKSIQNSPICEMYSVLPKGEVAEPFDLAAFILTLANSAC